MHFGLIGQWRRIPANKQGVKGGIVELANAGYLLPYFALILMTSLPSREKLYVTPWQSGVHLTAKDEELFSQTLRAAQGPQKEMWQNVWCGG